ncbi:Isocitrate dehydrogenase kinase/phosphatase [BD1-7 clade bacterium]|uniref:Isocitrate dehydrogenase kinase/phosphatase n=1 Tax=BD1-7 clade bacterium TaxID=2029982 RepID=A0A5S9R162_9GAMM|nr:Isocitrate dehydrogenase kinase/phosphatase [BD1-7 clade bacterium]
MGKSTGDRISQAIYNGFGAFFCEFQNITLGAQARFETADWISVHTAMHSRLDVYKRCIRSVADLIAMIAQDEVNSPDLWRHAKIAYQRKCAGDANEDILQTFFNSVYCLMFDHRNIRDAFAFVSNPGLPTNEPDMSTILRDYPLNVGLQDSVREVLNDLSFRLPYENIERDTRHIVHTIHYELIKRLAPGERVTAAQFLDSLFYRNKAAYLVGRVFIGDAIRPFVVVFQNNEQGSIYVDTVLFDEDLVSRIFSFTRSYFMVDALSPGLYVQFLSTIMPRKQTFELYSLLGFGKHAKTDFVRKAVAHTQQASDEYEIAPGIRGMVMLVFTLPSFDYVYKIIKQRFTPPKDMTREQVRSKYRLVKRWDRVGRMADTQEFSNLVFDRRKFSDELMQELEKEVPSLIESRGNALILKHVYIERKMIPLNMYLNQIDEEETDRIMQEYGMAIKELAAANIFAGDMLLKNFGVTRHGRVVFYDYDEVCLLTECNFRKIPEPKTEEQAMSDQPWYSIAPEDIFPEEFRIFLSGHKKARHSFEKFHRDLYDADYWKLLQENIIAGDVQSVYPYPDNHRFSHHNNALND